MPVSSGCGAFAPGGLEVKCLMQPPKSTVIIALRYPEFTTKTIHTRGEKTKESTAIEVIFKIFNI
jgi:hypothetical protein